MIRNYFKTAWRNLNKHKLFSFINIFGLASGMTICMLALIKIREAYNYDNFHPNSNRTYRIITNLNRKGGEHFLCASSPLPLGNYLKDNNAFIENSATVYFHRDELTVNERKLFAIEAYVNTDFYKVFGFKLSSGQPAISPQTVVLTSETAERFFGKENPIGHVVSIDSSMNLLVTGVLEKSPGSSHLKFDMLLSMSTMPLLKNEALEDWKDEAAAYTYVQTKEGISQGTLKAALQNASKNINTSFLSAANKTFSFDVQPLDKISPGGTRMYNITAEPIVPNLMGLALIGFSILLLAFFNYVNLTLARSLDRAREVGIRKVTGALKRHVILQFLSESVLVAALAFCLAFIQLRLLSTLPTIQNMIGNIPQDKIMWLYFLVFTLFTGLLAGWIPAKVFAGFKPVHVLKGKFNVKLFGGVGLRKSLTVIQFAVSMAAIVTLSVFYRQSIYMATADYGFEKENILTMQLPQHSYERAAVSFAAVAGVESVAASSGMFGFSEDDNRFIKRNKGMDSINSSYFSVTPSFIKDLKLQLVAGENLLTAANDAHQIIVNEEACRVLQFRNSADAVGNIVWFNDGTKYYIAGVVKDFHFANFSKRIGALVLVNHPDEFRTLNLKVAASAAQNILSAVEEKWKALYPHQPFEAAWYSKKLYDQHLHEDDLVFIGLLTFMSVSIACLGLLGMVIYTTKNRAKEVSIRRVMGAGIAQVMVEISKGFMTMLLIAVCIGLPLGFMAGHQFLQQYAYRISLSVGLMACCAAALFCLGAVTIGWQTYKSAITNPVKSLRSE